LLSDLLSLINEICAISDPCTFVAGLTFRLGLGHLLTKIRGYHASLLQ